VLATTPQFKLFQRSITLKEKSVGTYSGI